MGNKIDRRDFLALMGLGGAGAVTMSCGDAPNYDEKWQPWVEPVDGMLPYVPKYYATTTRESGGCGLRVTVLGGRATKIDGNPDHPINQGALTARHQSTVQALYGAERLRKPRAKDGKQITWAQAADLFLKQIEQNQGKNISALTGNLTGSMQEVWTRFVAELGTGRWVAYEPFSQSDLVTACERVFGRAGLPLVSLKGADFICSLGARFLETWGEVTANSRDYGEMRTPDHGSRGAHVQVEAAMSATGANADEVLFAKPGSETLIALALLQKIAPASDSLSDDEKAKVQNLTAAVSLDEAALASMLDAHRLEQLAEQLLQAGNPLVLPAERLSLGEDAVAHYVAVLLLNKALGAIGGHFNFAAAQPITRMPSHQGVADLIDSLNKGEVGMLVIKDANPAYALPPDAGFKDAMGKAGFTVAFADAINETTALADLVIPVTHDLESWGEISTYQGIDMLMQPVMRPRWDVKQAEDHLMDALRHFGKEVDPSFREYLKTRWSERFAAGALNPDAAWREALKRGGNFQLPEPEGDLPVSGNLNDDIFQNVKAGAVDGLALVVVESARFGDGTYANRGWMQELPDAMTGVVWDSVLEISPQTAEQQGLDYGDVVRVDAAGKSFMLPIFISETSGNHVATFATGMGHLGFTPVFNRGVNAFELFNANLNAGQLYSAGPISLKLTKTGEREKIATPHVPGLGDRINTPLSTKKPGNPHYNRDLYQTVALGALGHEGGDHDDHGGGHHEKMDLDSTFPMHTKKNFYKDRGEDVVVVGRPEHFYDPYKWELGVDLNKCNGCGSCVTACYAENNLPVVGKDQFRKGREMSWLRINRYLAFSGDEKHKSTRVGFLPMMCQQCGNAPCESVCPSLATYHNREGLNAMIYNRCVGTRYCANNCSYKVRRFNWFTWPFEGDLNWQLNPAVTVRQKGVMEKCTFCVQRIRVATQNAREENREVKDGEVVTACQQACPARAIQFGNISDKGSTIYEMAHDARAYRALDSHLHTKPGVTYLKRVVLDEEQHG